jgi:hypothetical protein
VEGEEKQQGNAPRLKRQASAKEVLESLTLTVEAVDGGTSGLGKGSLRSGSSSLSEKSVPLLFVQRKDGRRTLSM